MKNHLTRLRTTLITGVSAILVAVAGNELGNVHSHHLNSRLAAYLCAIGFLVLSVISVRSGARVVSSIVAEKVGMTVGAPVSIMTSIVGFIVIVFVDLGILGVTAQRLLVGGAITGVIIGIAAQQSLGNVFSGIVLMLAHPFKIGDIVQVRSGSLGGVFNGRVIGLGLTYVRMEIDGIEISIPNSTLLAAAVGVVGAQGSSQTGVSPQ
ncbi:MAG TPA: mechanosensitive ion channel family protein [Acidimicrobiales bacterium]|nr:mechanosensitive ion channel family protein [Acidimicrobiales bacterium]